MPTVTALEGVRLFCAGVQEKVLTERQADTEKEKSKLKIF